uniref:Uncharacterized protein n=1 Tax=Oryza sativa subsp. japonica TaxID=39947 RepID=Q10K16_ORYSJ|nr:hypothetical protein LOC_Os03g28250 [Oryza sativa Japonica Group]
MATASLRPFLLAGSPLYRHKVPQGKPACDDGDGRRHRRVEVHGVPEQGGGHGEVSWVAAKEECELWIWDVNWGM